MQGGRPPSRTGMCSSPCLRGRLSVSFAAGSCARGGIPPSSRRQRGLGSASDVVRLCDATSGPRPGRGAQAKAVHAGTISKKAADRGGQREGGREGGREGERGRELQPTPTPTPTTTPTPTPTPTPTRTGVRVSGVIINADREILCLLLLCVRV